MAFGLLKSKLFDKLKGNSASLKNIEILENLLNAVKGSLYISKTSYQANKKNIVICYCMQGHGNITSETFAAWDLHFHPIDLSKLSKKSDNSKVTINATTFDAPQNVIKEFNAIMAKLKANLEQKISTAATPPSILGFKRRTYKLSAPLSDALTPLELNLELMYKSMKFKHSISPIDLLTLGTNSMYFHIMNDFLLFIGRPATNDSLSQSKALNLPSGREYQNMFKINLKKLKIFELIETTEGKFTAETIQLSTKVVQTDRSNSKVALAIKRGYIYNKDTNSNNSPFAFEGLHLALAFYALLEEPKHLPLNIILPILKKHGKESVVKNIHSIKDISIYTGKEVDFINALIKGEPLDINKIDTGKQASLEDSVNKNKQYLASEFIDQSDKLIQNNKTLQPATPTESIQAPAQNLIDHQTETLPAKEERDSSKAESALASQPTEEAIIGFQQESPPENAFISTDDIADEILEIQKLAGTINDAPLMLESNHHQDKEDLAQTVAPHKEPIIFRFSTGSELKLRFKEVTQEITLQIVTEKHLTKKNFNKKVIIQINQFIHQTIQSFYSSNVLYKKDSIIYLRRNLIDTFKSPIEKNIYKKISQWNTLKDKQFKKIWDIPSTPSMEFNCDITHQLLNILKVKSTSELDKIFKQGEYYLRYTEDGLKTYFHETNSTKEILKTISLSNSENTLGTSSGKKIISDIKHSLYTHYYQFRGNDLINCDATRVLDFLYDLAFYFNSETNNELPNKQTFIKLKKNIKELEYMGLIQRKILDDSAVTLISQKVPHELNREKKFILNFFKRVSEKYKGLSTL